jgi:site-specific DNA-methyltransferase (adenine-specific)
VTVHYERDGVTLHAGDCRELLAAMPEASADAVVTDPPYDLISGSRGGSGRSNEPDNPFGRHGSRGGGFMGLGWDATGIAFLPETWAAVLRVLKPGAHLLAFGGTRTYHRMACAIEDAGFEIRDSLHWLFGTGFPKSLNIGSGLGTALKPAHEPIVMARKPLVGTVEQNVREHGTGALNVDACRIRRAQGDRTEYGVDGDEGCGSQTVYRFRPEDRASYGPHSAGRWPANVLLSHPPECGETCAPGCAVSELDAQSGFSAEKPRAISRNGSRIQDGWGLSAKSEGVVHGDSGTASRFFYVAKPSRAERDAGCARNFHPTVKPIDLMRHLVRLVTPPGGLVLDPFTGSGTTACACVLEGFRFVGCELTADYLPIIVARIQHWRRVAAAQAAQLSLF